MDIKKNYRYVVSLIIIHCEFPFKYVQKYYGYCKLSDKVINDHTI